MIYCSKCNFFIVISILMYRYYYRIKIVECAAMLKRIIKL